MSAKTTQYAILTYSPEVQGWFISRALPPTSERAYRRGQERLVSDNSYETDDISSEIGSAARPPSGIPSRSVERAARRALKLQRKVVEFRERDEPGGFGQEGWDIIWTA